MGTETSIIQVENIRCGGCANTITKRLKAIVGVKAVEVDTADQRIVIQSEGDVRAAAVEALASLGYPEQGVATGLTALKHQARSLVSCAIGRVDKSA